MTLVIQNHKGFETMLLSFSIHDQMKSCEARTVQDKLLLLCTTCLHSRAG